MKLTALILIVFGLHVSAKSTSQSITLSGKNLTLESIFAAIKKQTGYNALFYGDAMQEAKPVSVHVVNKPIELFLQEIFKNQPLEFTINKTSIVVNKKAKESLENTDDLLQLPLDSVPKLIYSGRVRNTDGQLLAGATIRVKQKNTATTSNHQGEFRIEALVGSTLVISYAGYITAEVKLTLNHEPLVVNLEPNSLLEEAVVYNGYQKIKQKYLTGSVTSISMDSIFQPGITSVDKMLEGRVPGMMFMQNSGQAGAAPKLRIRGTNTYLGSREPLWVVDGIVRTNPFPIDPARLNDPDFVNLLGNAISGLNPFDIEQIDVLKDATAAALYGVRAANGVIVITTKRGKPGPPTVNYNSTATFTQRPRYTDNTVYMMNSKDRVDVSRELLEKKLVLRGNVIEAYEKAIRDYYAGEIDYATFQEAVGKAETINTDWLGATMRDVMASHHTISVSGGNHTTSYRASASYRNEPGVIKNELNDLYTGLLNMQMNYNKFKVDFNVQINSNKRKYAPSEIGVLNYAYGTSRAIPLYQEDGSLYFYPTISNNANISAAGSNRNTMNILNEMQESGEKLSSNEHLASVDLSYEIAKGLQLHTRMAYTGGESQQQIWFTENTEWASQLRAGAYNATTGTHNSIMDVMPFGGELRQTFVNRKQYQVNARINLNRFLDANNRHQLSTELAADVLSSRTNSFSNTLRGYLPQRGHSFSTIDLTKYTAYASWLSNNTAVIAQELQNALRPYITGTYIFDDKYVFTASTSQEFSNAFGNKSNEKFLPTWALSGRWNIHDDILKRSKWINQLALLVSMGTRGNMLPNQTPYAIITKGALNTYYNANGATLKSFPNPNLAWEKSKDYNANLQFTLLDGRINGSFGYFYSKTSNAFLNKQVAEVHGAPQNIYVVNAGTLENQGVEIALNFKVIDNLGAGKKGFVWRFDPQLGQVFNKLINNSINSRNVLVDVATLNYEDYLVGAVPVNGKSVNTFYSYQFKGLNPTTGFPVFYGAEPENAVALHAQYLKMTKDQVYEAIFVESGRREPVIQGSFNNSFSYGQWTLNTTFAYSMGNKTRLLKIASGNYGTFMPSSQQNIRKEFVNRWRYPGDEQFTNIPGIAGGGYVNAGTYAWWQDLRPELTNNAFAENYFQMYDASDIRVVKGDYIKLQYIALSYRFSNDLCKKLLLKGGYASFSGTNLFTIAHKDLKGQDPSQSGSAPNINLTLRPVYAFNINISF